MVVSDQDLETDSEGVVVGVMVLVGVNDGVTVILRVVVTDPVPVLLHVRDALYNKKANDKTHIGTLPTP